MADKPDRKERDALKARLEEAQTTAKALAKDAAALQRQAAALKARAARSQGEARVLRASPPEETAKALWTVPEACRHLHVAARTLRAVLAAPPFQARLIERTRKVGIYYKFVPLVSADLMADLTAHFTFKNAEPPSEE